MGNPLQDRRTAAEWASLRQVIEIAEKISFFDGLAAIVEGDLGALEAGKMPANWRDRVVVGQLEFGFADVDERVPTVTGSATVEVDVVCQRCLQPFLLQLQIEPRLLLLEPEETEIGYDDFEVWELDQKSLRPQDIVEELLIMAMPFSAKHDNMANCKAFSMTEDGAEGMKTPFAALRLQMQQDEKDPDW